MRLFGEIHISIIKPWITQSCGFVEHAAATLSTGDPHSLAVCPRSPISDL